MTQGFPLEYQRNRLEKLIEASVKTAEKTARILAEQNRHTTFLLEILDEVKQEMASETHDTTRPKCQQQVPLESSKG